MEQKKSFPEFYITAPHPCPYLPGKNERKLFTHLTHDKSPVLVDSLLKGGFRRSQNIAYMPYCDACASCISVRVVVAEFERDQGLRRIAKRNLDLLAKRMPAQATSEQYSIFRAYIDTRHADGGMADMSMLDYTMMVEDSTIDTSMTEYRLRPQNGIDTPFERWPLIACSLSDTLSDGLSMVYSFFEPDHAVRSLGTYMILEHIEHARHLGLPYVYLGYWIEGSRKMSYKERFLPQERLTSQGWVRHGGGLPG
jgi:arginine-tRNA-protein transferase